MAKRASDTEFPSLCCGVCYFSHPDKDGDLECFVAPSHYIPDGVGGVMSTPRGMPIDDKLAPPCISFKPRMHS